MGTMIGLHAALGGFATPALAQVQGATSTTSTTTSSGTESPPACTTIGSQRTVNITTLQLTVGPGCIGIGNRDIPNPNPACGGFPAGDPEPFHGTTLMVIAGQVNTNTNVNTETITCVTAVPAAAPAAVPAMSWTTLWLAGLGLAGLAAWCLEKRSSVRTR